MSLRTTVRALIGLTLALAPALALAQGDDRESLEEFLRRAREEQAKVNDRLGTDVKALLERLEAIAEDRTGKKLEVARGELLALGDEAAPLIIDAIDAGVVARPSQRFRARQAALVLAQLDSSSVTDQLLTMVKEGSIHGRENALKVLENTTEPERVLPTLQEMYRTSEGEVRRAALTTMAHLGGPQAEAALTAALDDDEEETVEVALYALGNAHNTEIANRVLTLAGSERGPDHVRAILSYFTDIADAVTEPHVIGLIDLAKQPTTSLADQVLLLEGLTSFEVNISTQLKRAMEPLTESGTKRVHEASLVMLARLGDRNAKRELLKPYDDWVNRNKVVPQAYTSRGNIRYKVKDYKGAVKDYKDAIKLGRNNFDLDSDGYVMVARCYACQGRFKDAEEALEDAPEMSLGRLHALAKDPDFAEMVVHSKYRRAFHLPD